MRQFLSFTIALLLTLHFVTATPAAPPRVKIEQIRVGFQAEGELKRFKIGPWTPIRVELTNGSEVLSQNDYILVTESADGDDTPYEYTERHLLPTLQPGEQITLMTYVKPASTSSDISVSVRSSD